MPCGRIKRGLKHALGVRWVICSGDLNGRRKACPSVIGIWICGGWRGEGVRTRRTMFAAEEGDIYSIILHLLTPGRLLAPLATKRSHEYPSSVSLPRFPDASEYGEKQNHSQGFRVAAADCQVYRAGTVFRGAKGEGHMSGRDSGRPPGGWYRHGCTFAHIVWVA